MDTENDGAAGLPTVLQFHATWCAPCRALAPHLSRLEDAYRGKVEVRRVDVDKEPETAREFGVRGVPTLVVLDKGEERERSVGGLAPQALEQLFARAAGEAATNQKSNFDINRLRIPAVGLALSLTFFASQAGPLHYLAWLAFPLLVWGMAGRCMICSLATRGAGRLFGRITGRDAA